MYGAMESTCLVTPLMNLCKLLVLGLVLASLFHDCKLVFTNSAIAEHIDHHGGDFWHQEFDYGLVLYSLKQKFDVVVLKGVFFQPTLRWNSTYTTWIFDSALDLVSFPAPFVAVRTFVLTKPVCASPAMHNTKE
jgi:hypothetical protein